MGILTEDMRRVVNEQKLAFVATVCADGTPNLSPKGTTTVWDDDHLVFADICSPQTIANLARNPVAELNVVDVVLRKGYRFKGVAAVYDAGAKFDELLAFYRARGTTSPIRHIVLVAVQSVAPLFSPAYDQGRSETEVTEKWEKYWDELRAARAG